LSAAPSSNPHDECRCHCGSLLARLVDGAVELKCRRCKRTHRVPIVTDDEPQTTDPRAIAH